MGCFTCVMSNVTGNSLNLCNKCPKWLVEQNSGYSDYFNTISGFTSSSSAPGGTVTFHMCLAGAVVATWSLTHKKIENSHFSHIPKLTVQRRL